MADDIKTTNNRGEKKVNLLSIFSLVISLFSVVILVIVGVLSVLLFQRVNLLEKQVFAPKPEFAITNVSFDKEIIEYDYIEDTVTYRGSGVVIEKTGNMSDFLIVLSRTLIAGGSGDIGETDYFTIPMINGYADFSTYDYGDLGVISAPQYQFEILGYIEFEP